MTFNPARAHVIFTLVLWGNALLLAQQLHIWLLILLPLIGLMRLAISLQWQSQGISVRTLNLFGLLGAVALAYFAWGNGIMLAMVNLLTFSSGLKLLALNKPRDPQQLAVALLFLTACVLVFDQSIPAAIGSALLCFAILLAMLVLQYAHGPLPLVLRESAILSLQAAPIALLLFVVLPQLEPIWRMPRAGGAQTGLADNVSPGDIARLAQSSSLAFRATFNGDAPSAGQRYWRAIVMEEFDGQRWSVAQSRSRLQARNRNSGRRHPMPVAGAPIDYEVMAEPSRQHWLYALDSANTSDPRIWPQADFTLWAERPLNSAMQYKVRSYPDAPLRSDYPYIDVQLNLALPAAGNPRTQRWLNELRRDNPDINQLLGRVEAYMGQQGFSYTLSPPPMQGDMVDLFLFDYQQGFCGHYASAVAYLLRLAGVPARVVSGYQGGEWHERGFLSVYQYDAHAWVEYWSAPQQRWIRVDPTAWISPQRIEFGLQRAMEQEQSFLADQTFALAKLRDIAWINSLRLQLAELDYLWSRWVLGFDRQQQQSLLQQLLGNLSPLKLTLFSLAIVIAISLLLAAYYWRSWWPKKVPPHQRIYGQALKTISTLGIKRKPHWGIATLADQVNHSLPNSVSQPFSQLSELHEQLTYNPNNDHLAERLQHMQRLLKTLQQSAKSLCRPTPKTT